MFLNACLVLLALAVALGMRPWRLLASRPGRPGLAPGQLSPLLSPMLAVLVLLPWIWALPSLHKMPLQLPWSAAPLVVLMLGWPLAVPVLLAVAAVAGLLAPAMPWSHALGIAVWQGLVPATLALLWGAGLRRWLPQHIFVYLLGRAFVGTVLSVFAASVLARAAGHGLPTVGGELSLIALWLMAWGDAVTTGMLASVFVVFRPQWMATWSDHLYLPRPLP